MFRTPVALTLLNVSASSNTTSMVSSNGPAFLLLQTFAMSLIRAISKCLVFDGERFGGVVQFDGVINTETIDGPHFDIRWRERKCHVAFPAQTPGEVGMQHIRSGHAQHRGRHFLAVARDDLDHNAPLMAQRSACRLALGHHAVAPVYPYPELVA